MFELADFDRRKISSGMQMWYVDNLNICSLCMQGMFDHCWFKKPMMNGRINAKSSLNTSKNTRFPPQYTNS